MIAKSLEQLKIDAKRSGWPWPIEHPNDERALLNGCRTDFKAAERVRRFFEGMLVVPQEGGGTKPFVLIDWWYRDVLAPLFGWKRADGRRRFDKGFVTTAKKSGKSTVLAGLPLYMMIADGEEEAECYSTAVDRDQASIIYKKVSRMVQLAPELESRKGGILKRVDSQKRIVYEAKGSWYEAISSDADSTEGKNPHLLIADELHVWKDRQFFNALMYGDIARTQPLFLMITTAGDDPTGIGFEEYNFAKDLLDPTNDFYSESHFAFVAEASEGLEWDDPKGWEEANPSLACGALGSVEKLQSKCDEARQTPRKQREFIRYICNRWVDSVEDPWLNSDAWDRCGLEEIPDHAGDVCWGGLDLSRVRDLTALCLAFRDGEYVDLKWWFWLPKSRLKELEDADRVPYRDWVSDGWIEATDGSLASIDYGAVRECLMGDAGVVATYELQDVGFDPYNASSLTKELMEQDGLKLEIFRQGMLSYNAPCKELERLVIEGKLRHGKNPVATWMSRHCVVARDKAGNIMPAKDKSIKKIDGMAAAAMAIGRMMVSPFEQGSVYDTPGSLCL